MDLEQLGSGGPNPCGDSVKKRVLIFLSVFAVGLGPAGWDGVKPIGKGAKENEYSFF